MGGLLLRAGTRLDEIRGRRGYTEGNLFTKTGDDPQEQGKTHTEDEASDDGEVERAALAAVDDVSRQAAEPEGKFRSERKERTDQDEEGAEDEESAAEVAQRVHQESLRGPEWEVKDPVRSFVERSLCGSALSQSRERKASSRFVANNR